MSVETEPYPAIPLLRMEFLIVLHFSQQAVRPSCRRQQRKVLSLKALRARANMSVLRASPCLAKFPAQAVQPCPANHLGPLFWSHTCALMPPREGSSIFVAMKVLLLLLRLLVDLDRAIFLRRRPRTTRTRFVI